jgi:hypothetical protein
MDTIVIDATVIEAIVVDDILWFLCGWSGR